MPSDGRYHGGMAMIVGDVAGEPADSPGPCCAAPPRSTGVERLRPLQRLWFSPLLPARHPLPGGRQGDDVTPTDRPLVETVAPFGSLPACPHPLRHPLRAIAWLVSLGAGLASLVLLLSILAAIPVANVFALGYMLEGEGRVVRSGRLRDGVPLIGGLPRLGAVVFGTWAWLLVVRWVSWMAADAALVDPGGPTARRWAVARVVVAVLVGVHVLLAWRAGGSLTAFVRPIHNVRSIRTRWREGTAWSGAADAIAGVIAALRPLRLFGLGLGGFAGAFLWLLVPTLLFSALRDTQHPAAVLVMLVGAALLLVVLQWVPLMQARFAAEGRLAAFREVAAVRELHRRAPVLLLGALVLLYGLSLPLFLFKVVAAPRDAVLFLTPIFVVTIFPARLALGWAIARAARRPRRQWGVVRLACTAIVTAALALYLFLLFFTPAIDAHGRRVLLDHHALLLPTPF